MVLPAEAAEPGGVVRIASPAEDIGPIGETRSSVEIRVALYRPDPGRAGKYVFAGWGEG